MTAWLDGLGLEDVGEGAWRHVETGLSVATKDREEYVTIGDFTWGLVIVQMDDGRARVACYFGNDTHKEFAVASADRFADALKLAATIARQYNAHHAHEEGG